MTSSATGEFAGNPRFQSTRWSLVLTAADSSAPDAKQALATLCELYWYPLYVFVRRQGLSRDDAQDVTQGFFARLLEKNDIDRADPGRGRFRTYLIGAYKHYLANWRDRQQAARRGGGTVPLPLDFQQAEERFLKEPAVHETPESIYHRQWVLTLLDHVLGALRAEFEAEGRLPLFEGLKPLLTADGAGVPYRELGLRLGMSESAVKVNVHRLRKRYRDLLKQSVAHTVDDPSAVREEIQFLLTALGRA